MTDENTIWTEQTPDGDTIRIYPALLAGERAAYEAALAQRRRDDGEAYARLRDGNEAIEDADLPPSVRRLLR